MRLRWLRSAALLVLLLGMAGPAFAQGGGSDVNEEVKRAVERAVGASVSSSVAESLSRSIVSEGLRLMPTTTVFGSPFYNRTDGDFGFGSFKADTYGGVIGALYKVNDYVLLHGALSAAGTHVDASATGAGSTSIDARFFEFRLGSDLVFLNTEPAKAWFTLEAGAANFDTDVTDNIWAWRVAPSVTFSVRGGPILFEPTIGFAFTNSFDNTGAGTVITFNPGFAVKYRGEKFRPQLNFQYSKVIDPGIIAKDDDGFITVGPEILYAITPAVLVGGAYSYGTSLNKGVDINSHTVTLEIRWIF
jgi:hypothetical protein